MAMMMMTMLTKMMMMIVLKTILPHTHTTTSRYCSRLLIMDDVGKIDVLRIFESCLLYLKLTRCTAHLDRPEDTAAVRRTITFIVDF